jgi:predicted house-cleaning noncanonical NTP pyrophosphatase (MazG superfamily)
MKQHNKLIRDNIPEILDGKKIKYKCHIAKKIEFKRKLYEKLNEEIKEFKIKPSIDEFVDILEVIEYIGKYYGYQPHDISLKKTIKKLTNGGFDKKIILETTEK